MVSWQWRGLDGESIVWANLIDSAQTTLALASAIVWLVGEYWTDNEQYAILRTQFAFSVAYTAALLAQLASRGLRTHRQQWLAFDAVVSLPIFYQAYQLGYYSGEAQGWQTLVSALQVPLQWLVVARFLRIVRLFQRTTLRSGALVISSDLVRSVTSLLFTVFCFIVIGGGLLHLIENAFATGNDLSTWEAMYTVFGVITVIGWGNAPNTALGQLVDMLVLLVALIILPLQINNLIDSVSNHYKHGLAYTGRAPHVVMVVYPTMTGSDLASMLREFYSSHPGLSAYRCVLLGAGGESHRRTLLQYVATSAYWSSVTYIVGSPSSVSSLRKVAVDRASAVFLLTSAWFADPGQELAEDEQSLMQAISIKQFCPSVPLILSLNKPRNRAHVLWWELFKFPNIQAVCLNEVKLQLLATQAMAPGLLGLIANLLQFGGHKEEESTWWRSGLVTRGSAGYQLIVNEKGVSDPPMLSSWPLSFAVPADRPAGRAIQRSWEMQYITGFLQELRTCPLPPALSGLCFAEVAAVLYERLLVVLLAVGRPDARSGKLGVMLNPGYGARLGAERGDLLCLMVQSAEHARAVSQVQWDRETVRERWLRQRTLTASPVDPRFTSLGSPVSAAMPFHCAIARYYTDASKASREPTPQHKAAATKAPQMWDSEPSELPLPPPLASRASAPLPAETHVAVLSPAPGQEMKREHSDGASVSGPTARPIAAAAGSQERGGAVRNPLSGHIVMCGFIDSRIVTFIRRFRASDSRPIVLVMDNAVCYPLPAVTQEFITAHFRDVHLIYASHTYKARHQRARVYLSYSDCCFGHHHRGANSTRASERRGSSNSSSSSSSSNSSRRSEAAVSSCVSSRGGVVESERERLMRPTMSIDEVGLHDRTVADSVIVEQRRRRRRRYAEAQAGADGRQAQRRVNPPRYCRLRDHDPEPAEMDAQAVLRYASWYRRACVHSADAVFVLANSYAAPPDSTSSNGGTALNDDTAIHRDHVYLISLFQYSQRTPTDAVKDDQTRADQHSLILYAGIQTYLQQCRRHGCSLLSVRAEPPAVVVELLYHLNVRLLKQGSRGISSWRPHRPQPVGLRWLLQLCRRPEDPRIAEPVQYSQAAAAAADAEDIPGEDSADRRKALYSSDGLTMSSRLLDSLIVQAFIEPLVYETVCALGSAHTHVIPAKDWRSMGLQGGVRADLASDDEGDECERESRSFRVELMLLDVPAQLVDHSWGFLQLLSMVEHGWVAMGLYRDKRSLAAAAESDQAEAEQSPFFVFTNPPPDTLLVRTDRIYALVQRWLSVDTAEAVLGQCEQTAKEVPTPPPGPADHGAPVHPAPLTAPAIPLTYSPRIAPFAQSPALPLRMEPSEG